MMLYIFHDSVSLEQLVAPDGDPSLPVSGLQSDFFSIFFHGQDVKQLLIDRLTAVCLLSCGAAQHSDATFHSCRSHEVW